ncbi:MAG: hypothetical protein L0H93_03070 [Nocardioides sp.]|nr:hypothetical protein [Nocardioides sp.]
MLVFGVILIALAALSIVGAVFLIDGGHIEYFGIDMPALYLFVIGALTVVFIGTGLRLIRYGTRRSLQSRREHRELRKLNEEKRGDLDRPGSGNGDREKP